MNTQKPIVSRQAIASHLAVCSAVWLLLVSREKIKQKPYDWKLRFTDC